ncbi:MAG TPA: glycosyltransferase family 2 protein [Polyangia bacterium]|nr:glycosyltransferase family 2 protein [Polyangia bacterium]
MDPSLLDVIVLNWRTPDMSAEGLRLAAESLPGAALYLVDNGSGDGSPERLRQLAPPGTTVIETGRNLGFGGGFNAGIRAGKRPFLITLNSDARPTGSVYRELLDHCASDDRLGAVTPQTIGHDNLPVGQMAPEPPAWRLVVGCLPGAWRLAQAKPYWPKAGPPEMIDWFPSMCATLFRRAAIEGIGGFDSDYFLGWEEWDLARRLRAAGWKIAIHPGAAVVHEGQGSTPKPLTPWRSKHARDGICHHLRKYYGPGWYAAGRLTSGIADLYMGLRARSMG